MSRPGVPVPEVDARTVVLVEGESDRAALAAAALQLPIDLGARGVVILPMGGVSNICHYLRRLGPTGRQHVILGLYDSAEAAVIGRALVDSGGTPPGAERSLLAGDPNVLAQHGFQVCHRDLEDELIRAIGAEQVIQIIAAAGELRAWHSMQQQPAQRGRPVVDQLRRWLGSGATRKIRYAPLLVSAIPPGYLPPPLTRLLEQLATRDDVGTEAT